MQGFMQSLWIYPEDTEVLGVACKSLLKALKSCYQKIALFSPIDGGCEGFLGCYGLNSLEFHSAIDKQKALELVSAAQEELLFETILKRYDGLQTTHDFVINLGYAAKFLNTAYKEFNAISLHLGNGSSAVAIQKGKSVDTSMGLTPLEGLIMGTRCGDIDPTVVEYIAQCANKRLEEVMKILNHESGLKRIFGDNDARNIEARKEKGDKQAKLAFEMCAYRIKKDVGAYMAVLKKVDAIIFTGGMGENYPALRESVCEGLEVLGIALHKPTNDNPGNGLVDLSQPDSKVKVLRIPTDEELEIALQAKEIAEKLK